MLPYTRERKGGDLKNVTQREGDGTQPRSHTPHTVLITQFSNLMLSRIWALSSSSSHMKSSHDDILKWFLSSSLCGLGDLERARVILLAHGSEDSRGRCPVVFLHYQSCHKKCCQTFRLDQRMTSKLERHLPERSVAHIRTHTHTTRIFTDAHKACRSNS